MRDSGGRSLTTRSSSMVVKWWVSRIKFKLLSLLLDVLRLSPLQKKHEHLSACMRKLIWEHHDYLFQGFLSINQCFGACGCRLKKTFHCSATVDIQQVLPYLIISCSLPIFPKEQQVSIFAMHLNHPLQISLIKMHALAVNRSTHHTHSQGYPSVV